MIGDLRKAQIELEDYSEKMMQRWDEPARFLIVRYNDQIVCRVGEDGKFARWGYDTPGYDLQFIDAIKKTTGDRYLLKEFIDRGEKYKGVRSGVESRMECRKQKGWDRPERAVYPSPGQRPGNRADARSRLWTAVVIERSELAMTTAQKINIRRSPQWRDV